MNGMSFETALNSRVDQMLDACVMRRAVLL